MTTLPALPTSQTFESAENLLAQQLQHACAVKPNARLNISQLISGEWILSASPELDAATIEAALREAADMEIFHVPADPDEVENAIAKLKSVTSRPVWMDNSDAINWEEELSEAMAKFPIDVVRTACVAWRQVPKHGEWWPTDQGLTRQCEAIFKPRRSLFNKARMLLQDIRNSEAERQRTSNVSSFASGAHRKFRDEMAKRMSADRYRAYFDASEIQYAGDVIQVRSKIAETILEREGGDLLAELCLHVVYAPEEFAHVRRSFAEDSPEQSAIIAKKMARLLQALSKNENLRALRDAGEI